MQGAQGRLCRPVAIFDGRALRALCNPPGAYWVVREEGFRSDNAADGHSWTGSYEWIWTAVSVPPFSTNPTIT